MSAVLASSTAATQAPLPVPGMATRRDWKSAWRALRALLRDGNDTVQVFRIMRALNADVSARNYHRLLRYSGGGRIAYRGTELATLFNDTDYIARFAPGTVGADYRAFLNRTGYSATGLADVATSDNIPHETEHPYAWYARRERDIHDIWHVLTGYQADEPLGEACLVAFSYAQTRGLGWAAIALGASVKAWRITGNWAFGRAVLEGYRRGKRAAWLSGEDYEQLMHEPIDAVRQRLRLDEPARYRAVQAALQERGQTGL